jgi:hypothetical protein
MTNPAAYLLLVASPFLFDCCFSDDLSSKQRGYLREVNLYIYIYETTIQEIEVGCIYETTIQEIEVGCTILGLVLLLLGLFYKVRIIIIIIL